MKSRIFTLAAASAVVLTSVMPVQADWHSFWARFKKDFRRVNSWPAPFEYVDRDNTRGPLEAMIAKGWQRQHTLGSTYFDRDSHELTTAGQEKISTILQTAAPEQRTIFVVTADSPESSETRIQSVQETLARINSTHPIDVLPVAIEPEGQSASYVNAIQTKMRESIPVPRLKDGGIIGAGGGN